ncbi:7903_t:CDS:2 [Funneliformis geosporum]|nr:7903_t:CDS:2 [Funneliformis geosporum]
MTTNIYAKLSHIQNEIEVPSDYNYSETLKLLTPLLEKHKLTLTLSNDPKSFIHEKIKKQEEMIDILVGEVKRLKTELIKYELIKELINNESGNFLVERKRREILKRQGIDLGYSCDGSCETETNQEAKGEEIEVKKVNQYIEEDIKRIQVREQNSTKADIKNQKRKRKGISKQEAMKHSKPSKKKNKVICKDCGGEYLTQKLLKLHLDSLGNQNQQKEASELEEKNEEIKKSALELKEKMEEISQKLITNEAVAKTLLENVDKSIKGEIVNQQKLFQDKNKELSEKLNKDLELRLNNNQQLIKTHLENLNKGISQPLEKLNSVLLHSGNTQLDELLSSYLPKENGLYQTEFQLKKRRTKNKEEGLRVDAIVFSADNRNNIAIDSKFPLENYLSSADGSLTEEKKEQFEKRFENDVKKHIDKVAEYFSPEEDGINARKLIEDGEKIKNRDNALLKTSPKDLLKEKEE